MPSLSDIFQYLDPRTVGATQGPNAWVSVAPGTHMVTRSNENGTWQEEVPNDATTPGALTIDQSKIPSQYQGLISQYTGAQGGSQGDVGYDLSKLPNNGNTALGNITQMYSLGSGANPTLYMAGNGRKQDAESVMNRNQVTWDPNYGWITSKTNITHPNPEAQSWIDKVGQAGMMGASLFMGPQMALAFGGLNALRQGGETGNWKNAALGFAPSVLGSAVGGLGGLNSGWSLPPELTQALQYAKTGQGIYNAARSNDPMQQAGTLAGLWRMFNGGGG